MEVNISTGASSDKKDWRKLPCKFPAVSSRKPNWSDRFPWHHTAHTAEEWHAWVSSTKEVSPKAHACLEFARAHAEKDEDYWDSTLWSDETKITVFGTHGYKTVWRHKGEDFKEKCMLPTVRNGGGSVLMWGCMSAAGVRELHFIDGIMNSTMYCSILKEKMLP